MERNDDQNHRTLPGEKGEEKQEGERKRSTAFELK